MSRRLIVGLVALGAVGIAVPASYAATAQSSPVPSACVVVNGPNGATVQVGYAPDGPAGCT